MTIYLDPKWIRNFRDTLNKRAVRDKFSDVEGTDVWNIMCSATDWIEVVVETISNIKIAVNGIGPDHQQTVILMQYIVALDNLRQAIKQLYEFVIGPQSYPMSNDRSIFKQEGVTDEQYFAHTRAVFATHPVDLHSINGVRTKDKETFYASWASHDIGDNDFIVFLYSSKPGKPSVPFGIKLDDVNRFTESRYALLDSLIREIKRMCSLE